MKRGAMWVWALAAVGSGVGDERLPSIGPVPPYTTEVTRHTFHGAGSAGSDCLNGHMPHTSYALFRAIRSHQIASPGVAASARYGTPNACNLCHLDRTLGWAQRWLGEWYGQEEVVLSEEQREVSAAVLWVVKGNAAQRVVAGWHSGWAPAPQVRMATGLTVITSVLTFKA